MRRTRVLVATGLCAVASLLAPVGAGAQAPAGPPFAVGGFDSLSLPARSARPGRQIGGPGLNGILNASDASPLSDRVSVPTWQGSFRVKGKPYRTLMVGTDPAAGSATTTVPLVLVPLRFVFSSDGRVLENPGMAADVAASPMVAPIPFRTGITQYGDAYQRGSFWSQVSTVSPDYHVLLGGPTVVPAQTLDVPVGDGITYLDPDTGLRAGIVQDGWFQDQVARMIADLNIDPRALVAFLADNTSFADDPSSCFAPAGCSYFLGYHNALPQSRAGHAAAPLAVNTFLAVDYIEWGNLVPPSLDLSLDGFSHEVLEWIADPFALTVPETNAGAFGSTAPRWTSPLHPQLCSPVLEVSDPVEGLRYAIGAPAPSGKLYALEDAAMFSWFARQSPSTAVDGRYDVARVLTGVSPSC